MRSLSELSDQEVNEIEVVFADIDDTISSKGKILPEAYGSLWKLCRSGIDVVPITGRCAGWVDHIARMWPVKGVVGENGAFYAYMDSSNGIKRLKKRYFLDPKEVKEAQKNFEKIKKEVFSKFPTAQLASDQPYREFDLAIDFCEDVPPLTRSDVLEIVKIYEKHGAHTKISSIHVNGWFGDYDKLTMTKIFAEEQLGYSENDLRKHGVFIGDSPNDQPMFRFFPKSVGVNNVRNFEQLISDFPCYITEKESGLGFSEFVSYFLSLRDDKKNQI